MQRHIGEMDALALSNRFRQLSHHAQKFAPFPVGVIVSVLDGVHFLPQSIADPERSIFGSGAAFHSRGIGEQTPGHALAVALVEEHGRRLVLNGHDVLVQQVGKGGHKLMHALLALKIKFRVQSNETREVARRRQHPLPNETALVEFLVGRIGAKDEQQRDGGNAGRVGERGKGNVLQEFAVVEQKRPREGPQENSRDGSLRIAQDADIAAFVSKFQTMRMRRSEDHSGDRNRRTQWKIVGKIGRRWKSHRWVVRFLAVDWESAKQN